MRKELIAQNNPKAHVSEMFRTLRTNIQFMNTKKKMKVILVTSSSPGEGKSWVSANLAVTFAQAGKKVILVDADMRKGRQYTIFGTSPKLGLSNYLSGIDENDSETNDYTINKYIQNTEIENLSIMVAGNIPPNPSELLISTQMIELLEKLEEISDIVIIDGTPCELVTDSIILSRLADSTLIVTAYEETKRDNLQRVITSIKNVGGEIVGVVINKIPINAKKYTTSYYYSNATTQTKKRRSGKRISKGIREIIQNKNITNSQNEEIKLEENEKIENEDIEIQNEEIQNEDIIEINEINNEEVKNKKKDAKEILKQINDYINSDKNIFK